MKKFPIQTLTKNQKILRKRVLELSYENHLSHIGSCLSSIDLIDAVYSIKKDGDKFVLSNGHAGIALYVVLEKNGFLTHNDIKKLYIHPDRNLKLDIHVSTGSLGQGLPIALGMALASPEKNIYCMISDGECAEGSIWETLRIAKEKKVNNLKVVVNFNGWGGYDSTSKNLLKNKFVGFGYATKEVDGHNTGKIKSSLKITKGKYAIIFGITNSNQFYFLKDQDAHYCTMTQTDYSKAVALLKK
ncbi:MAG: 1-deoxy-D-xylulose-5-phosphate synthase N-terminal domain-containing protein [Candidatus Levybacteria bacterium]|nr:1-deoxy-D-xylulose-5-phosphate synthase N-terminal domain-containing protein [Candidatus Levybacteria bacterium]